MTWTTKSLTERISHKEKNKGGWANAGFYFWMKISFLLSHFSAISAIFAAITFPVCGLANGAM